MGPLHPLRGPWALLGVAASVATAAGRRGAAVACTPPGAEGWSFPTGDWVRSSPALGPDGTVYVLDLSGARLGDRGAAALGAVLAGSALAELRLTW
eukprot:COSAG01_NODE_30899_length_607_cov_2.503937_1_plen_95_part_01